MDGWFSGIIGAAIGFLASWLMLKYNYSQLFAQTVSSTREKWLCIFRENLAKFLACAERLNECPSNVHSMQEKGINNEVVCLRCELEKEKLEAYGMIVSRLNMDESVHREFFYLLSECFSEKYICDFALKREKLYNSARKLFKIEWERVKREAKGKGK